MPVALVGRVPVNVTNEGGAIAAGDYITTSSTAGKAMKATKAGRVIGMALADFSGASGQMMVQVFNTWYEPGVLTVLASGRVGIGQVNPGATLDVNGDGRFANSLTVAAGGINVTGSSTFTGRVYPEPVEG